MNIGKILIFSGFFLIIAGIIFYFFYDKFSWIGNTFLDFKYKTNNTSIYFPLGTMIILSILLSFIINLINKFLK